MTLVRVADRWFRIATDLRDGQWHAHASSSETGDRFGPELDGATEADAVARLSRWLAWQSDHAAALAHLQEAERAYHRSVTSGAFVSSDDRFSADERRHTALRDLEAARLALDGVRARRPD